ncbi:MAG TPA: DUF4255 domain-containing protein [Sphingomicrobium sp.]|nr:DUF4255 domain-containing protein [Sphingomicrobium sp.]
MSSALAIAAVTAALKDIINNGFVDHDLSTVGNFTVTSQPPDRITTGATEANQLNLFLYQITPNLGWRNADLPARDRSGVRISNPPLAVDLHFLLSAYGAEDLNAEVLLGFAMQILHETPVLAREQLRIALGSPAPIDGTILPGPFGTLSALDLADQVELIKITPEFLGAEELSKLWTAMQARYRPSMSYLVTVVLIRREGDARIAPPVLQRGADDRGPTAIGLPPALTAVRNIASPLLPGARLGDDLAFLGNNLLRPGVITALFECHRLGIRNELPAAPGPVSNELLAHLPATSDDDAAMANWAAGIYSVALRVAEPDVPAWTTNSIPLAIAPRIEFAPDSVAVDTEFDLTVSCSPRVRPLQEAGVRLIVGTTEILPKLTTQPPDTAEPTSLVFSVPGLPSGTHLIRLRVDGIDSLPIKLNGVPPEIVFDPGQMVTAQ